MNILQSQLKGFLTDIQKETGIPGVCLAMNIGGKILTVSTGAASIDNLAPINEGTHFQLGCLSKLLTAIISAEMISAGGLDLNEPIEKYLAELKGTYRGKNLFIWHLLSHTSGYRGLNIPTQVLHFTIPGPNF